MSETNLCELCGEPMPKGEEMFKYHGYSCDCPKPPLKEIKSESGGSESCEAHRPIEELKKEFSENFTDWYPCAETDNCWWKLISKSEDEKLRYITPDMVWGWIEKKLSVR